LKDIVDGNYGVEIYIHLSDLARNSCDGGGGEEEELNTETHSGGFKTRLM
jgi:hypothetical protein